MSAGPPPPADDGTFSGAIRKRSAQTMYNWLRLTNSINAIGLALASVFTFVDGDLDVEKVLAAIYVGMFAVLLLLFAMRLKRFERSIVKSFGFMFTSKGRLLFFLFCGTMCFGLGTIGIIVGCYTAANLIFNVYVLHTHPTLSQYIAQDLKQRRAAAAGSRPSSAGVVGAHNVALEAGHGSGETEMENGGFVQHFDEATGRPYYVNEERGITQWDPPAGFVA